MQDNKNGVQAEANLIKKLYFWSFIAFGMISPFAGIFYKKVLVTPAGEPDVIAIGNILFWAPLMGLVANSITGVLSDRFQKGRHIMSFLCVGAFFAALLVGFGGGEYIGSFSSQNRYTYMFAAVLIFRFLMMPLNALMDSEAMQFLSLHGDRSQYGTFRFWGTIGWAVATPIMGAVLWKSGNYQLIFFVGSIGYLIFAYLGMKSSGRAKISKVKIPWRTIVHDWRFLLFLVFTFLVGIVENSTATYMGYFFDDVMDTPLKIGIIFSFWTTLEIPVMKYSKQLISHLGNTGLVALGLLLSAVKLVLFSMFTLETPFYLQMLAALIHGPAFAFLFLGTIDIVDRMAHEKMRATYMSTTAIARYTLSGAVGAKLGSVLISEFGGALFMRIGAGALLILIPAFLLMVRIKPEKTENIK